MRIFFLKSLMLVERSARPFHVTMRKELRCPRKPGVNAWLKTPLSAMRGHKRREALRDLVLVELVFGHSFVFPGKRGQSVSSSDTLATGAQPILISPSRLEAKTSRSAR